MPGQDPNSATPIPKKDASSRTPALSPAGGEILREAQNSPVKPRVPCGEAVSDPWIPESKLPPIPKKDASSRTPAPSPAGGEILREAHTSSVKPRVPCGEAVSDPWIPESKLPPISKNSIKSIVRNILLTNPLFPRFYADVVIASAPNSNEAKILASNYQKIIDRTSMPNTRTCTHIKVTGVRCDSPALRGEQFCYFHQRMIRGVRTPPRARLHPIAQLESEEAIQASLMEVINALIRDTIDTKRAELIIRALHIAVKNAHRARFNNTFDVVKEIPDYAAATENVGADALARPGGPEVPGRSPATTTTPDSEFEMPYSAAIPPYPTHERQREIRQQAKDQVEQDRQAAIRASLIRAAQNVGSGPRIPKPAESVPPHDFKKQKENREEEKQAGPQQRREVPPQRLPQPSRLSTAGNDKGPTSGNGVNSHANKSPRKPPVTATPAPKERKNAAHSLP